MRRRYLTLFALLFGVLLVVGYSWASSQLSLPLSAAAEDPLSVPIPAVSAPANAPTVPNGVDHEAAPLDRLEELRQSVVLWSPASQAFRTAVSHANQASQLAQTARSAEDWDGVAQNWTAAIAQLQSIPPQSPQRVFVQRKIQEYLDNLVAAQRQAAAGSFPRVTPSLGSASLDEQLVLYRSYLATMGLPDVLIVGSSRSLQGVDPVVLQQGLAQQGYANAKVYNFGIHGATAQVIDVLLRQILAPEQLPSLIVWPEGSRAFNNSRPDHTYNAIINSAGYRALTSRDRAAAPTFVIADQAAAAPQQTLARANTNGFIPVPERFEPGDYYRRYPRVAGRYDADYYNFNLNGPQGRSLRTSAAFAKAKDITLVYVNLPLTQDYLDPVRQQYEQQYRQWMQSLSRQAGFQFIDLMEPGLSRNEYFADPSHINQFGAAAIARRLATHPQMPWSVISANLGRSPAP